MVERARVGVVGAAGYVGGELVRWILGHPALELTAVVSTSSPGKPLSDVLPGLLGLSDLVLEPFDAARLSGLDAVFLATPHGAAKPLAEQLDTVIVDCSADHRHAPGWVYGQPEFCAAAIRGARRIAAPGCFATAISLALAPLVRAGVIDGAVQVVGATGSTGSGATPSAGTHHPERFANFRAYKVLSHQHVPEVRAFLAQLGAAPALHFVPQSAPLDRGIFVTAFMALDRDLDAPALFADTYGAHARVRIRPGTPEIRFVRGTAFCDLSIHQDDRQVVVLSALDNLGKGAASQAVQCLELALDLPEATRIPPCTP